MNKRLNELILRAGLQSLKAADELIEAGKKVVEISVDQVVRGTAPLRGAQPGGGPRAGGVQTASRPAQSQAAPALTFEAAGSGRKLRLDMLGRPALLLCHGQGNATAARDANLALQEHNPGGRAFDVLHIVDLKQVPGLLRGMARSELERFYRAAAAYLDDPAHAPDRVYLLADWAGAAAPALGLGDVNRAVGLAALDATGNVLGLRQSSADPAAAALELLRLL